MCCAECQQLRADVDKNRRRHSDAVCKLDAVEGRVDSETLRMLRIRVIEARLYMEMAHLELSRHEALQHQAQSAISIMTA